ncbi:hypothetical protein QBC35DRAFT_476655 [Podospora australis]|uniref:Uncharacterized protein n=1 Tax=Podospora australis TaxID=1536484 RepID=A0AAN7AGK4_9PEZI|nr:hypothetical protein QBC35DRAFT_476655 [Podospora australis]
MKSITALILTLATLAAASPAAAPASSGNLELDSRQTCSYRCLCNLQNDPDSELPDPDNIPCCNSVGGTLDSGNTICDNLTFATATSFAACCGQSGGYTCFTGRGCTPIVG